MKPYFEQKGITLYHGDCRAILSDLPAEQFDMIITDPPYLVSYSGRWGGDGEIIEGDADSTWVALYSARLGEFSKTMHSAARSTAGRTPIFFVNMEANWLPAC